jgi:metallothiol transferase
MVLKVAGIDHVVFHVRDLARSKRFYIDLLGMELHHGDASAAFLRCGEQQVALFEVPDGTEVHAGSEVNHMALRLAHGDSTAVKAALAAARVEVRGRAGDPHCIYLADPDGHQLQLLLPRAP